MNIKTIALAPVFAVALAGSAFAQGTVTRETTTTTTTTGGGTVVLAPEERTVVRRYVTEQKRPSVKLQQNVTVGGTLPADVELYAIEGSPTVSKYRYTVVNDRPVIVDPGSRRVIEVIE